MTGIRSFERNRLLSLLLACLAVYQVRADEIALTGEDRLSGSIRSINDAGVVELATPISPDPVFLKAGSVRKVMFSPPKVSPEIPGAMVELVNGDLLPASIESLDQANLTISTPYAGRMVIPRDALKSLQLGIRKRKVIYSGPRNLDEWLIGVEAGRNWRFENNALIANGQAYAARKFDLPQQFVVRFTLKWQGNPNFQIHLADPLRPKSEVSDRYYLQFAGAGLEIKRESTVGNRYTTVILSNRTPDQFEDSRLDVEIRVDRKTSRLHLLLNGEPEGAGIDPVSHPPDGMGVSLLSNSSNGNEQEIRSIEILEFDDAKVRHHSEQRGDPKTDSLISRDDDRWGGRLTDIRKSGDGLVFSFNSDFQDQPLELLESDVSTIFFAGSEATTKPAESHPFVLRLQENGLLRVTSCTFTEDEVSALHPLLGQLNIRRSGISAMERLEPDPVEETEE